MPVSFAILVIMLQISKLLKIKPRNVLLFVGYIKPWVMFDVYLVALAVTMFKVREYATLEVDVYLIAFVFTALLTTLLFIKINLDDLWHDFYPDQKPVTKSDKPLELCTACDYTFLKEDQQYDHRHRAICPRCASLIEIPESVKLQRVWATLVAGIIMLSLQTCSQYLAFI